jgi:predicted nucleic acid-binding protein
LILVDTSIWIEMARGSLARRPDPTDFVNLATCGPVLQELMQGLRVGSRFTGLFHSVPVLSDPLPLRLFRAAAEIYRDGRARGFTIRSSTDCLIAAIALDNQVPVWHRDRDFDQIARFTPLRLFRPA